MTATAIVLSLFVFNSDGAVTDRHDLAMTPDMKTCEVLASLVNENLDEMAGTHRAVCHPNKTARA